MNRNCPNYRGARIDIHPEFPHQEWSRLLGTYHDQQLIDFMRFGWPTSYMGSHLPTLTVSNHRSSLRQPVAVKSFIDKELSLQGLAGPFTECPFGWLRQNPLMTQEKKTKDEYRVILDLSFPEGRSVNSSIPKLLYDGSPYKLHLPTSLDMAALIARKGQGALMYKIDLSRAYRQLPADPYDWPLLGIEWEDQLFFDRAIPFGLCHGAMCCQRVTTAICHIMLEQFQAACLAYIDDFGAVAGRSLRQANTHYIALKTTIMDLGLTLALDKCASPSTCMSWIGTTFDSVNMCMYIDESKIQETLDYCLQVLAQVSVSLQTVESLAGRLMYASKLSLHARRFINQLLHFRRSFKSASPQALPQEVIQELHWFCQFLPKYNGFALIRPLAVPSTEFFVDDCLVGGGGFQPLHCFFSLAWGDRVDKWNLAINELECFTVLVALRLWHDTFRGKTVQVWCDNSATVLSLQHSKTNNMFTAACIREVGLLAAVHDIQLIFTHIEGERNITADLLSRADVSDRDQQKFQQFVASTRLTRSPVEPHTLAYPDTQGSW